MKRIIQICLFVLLALPTWSLASAIGPARVSYLNGEILFRSPDSEEWLPVTVNTPLDEGDALWCPDDSRVEIQLPDGSIVRLDGGSQLDLLANEDGFTQLHLASGHLYLRTAQITRDNSLQIDSDDTSVLPSARTRLRIDMLPNSLEDVAIIKGSAYVEGNGSRTRVRAGEHIMLEEGHNEILTLAPADSWELWNLDRDLAQSRSSKTNSYLPEELRSHAAELDASGSWVNVPEYGMVWRPTVIVGAEWAPYRSGCWIWKDDDYVWLSAEAWGWVPYHYGRWAVVNGLGWCWVPPVRGDVYWGPGYVGWYRTGSQIGWTPLAPGEVFYGHRNYGRNSINITNVTINSNTVVYRNRSYRGGVTVLPQNDFLRGRSAVQQPARTPSVSVSVSVGSPRIQPLRETRMPIVRQMPPRVAPPRIEHRDSRELRERFPRLAPAPAPDRRRQQTAPATSVPASPSGRTPQIKEKQTSHPVLAPVKRPAQQDQHQPQTTAPVLQPQQPIRQQRDERRQGTTPPQAVSQPAQPAAPLAQPQQPVRKQRDDHRQETVPPRVISQPAPPVTQSLPPVSGSAPQRSEQPRRAAPPADNQNHPAAVRPGSPAAPLKTAPQPAAPQQAGQPRREAAPKDVQQKKVWKVTTPEKVNEKESPEKDTRGNERRER